MFGNADEVGEAVALEGCFECELIDDDVLYGVDDICLRSIFEVYPLSKEQLGVVVVDGVMVTTNVGDDFTLIGRSPVASTRSASMYAVCAVPYVVLEIEEVVEFLQLQGIGHVVHGSVGAVVESSVADGVLLVAQDAGGVAVIDGDGVAVGIEASLEVVAIHHFGNGELVHTVLEDGEGELWIAGTVDGFGQTQPDEGLAIGGDGVVECTTACGLAAEWVAHSFVSEVLDGEAIACIAVLDVGGDGVCGSGVLVVDESLLVGHILEGVGRTVLALVVASDGDGS